MSETCRGHLWDKIIIKLFASSWYIFLTYYFSNSVLSLSQDNIIFGNKSPSRNAVFLFEYKTTNQESTRVILNVIHRMFLLSSYREKQLYRIENLHPPRRPWNLRYILCRKLKKTALYYVQSALQFYTDVISLYISHRLITCLVLSFLNPTN